MKRIEGRKILTFERPDSNFYTVQVRRYYECLSMKFFSIDNKS